MLNPPLVLVSALFFLALVSGLYVISWLAATAVLRAGQGRICHARAKRVLMTALVLPPILALVPTVTGATLQHLHGSAAASQHHNAACRDMYSWLSGFGGLGSGGLTSGIINGTAWVLIATGAFLLVRLLWATYRLERGMTPYLLAPSPRLVRALERVAPTLPGLPVRRFFECPIPAAYSSVLGFWHPRCVLSQEFGASATDEELDAVVAHEGSHLRGKDVLSTFVVGALNCLFFFLRPVRLLGRRWREAAELACDDAAVAATGQPLAMAAAILKASGVPLRGRRSLPAVALPFADEAACPPTVRVERLIARAQQASLAPRVESRTQVLGGWLVTLAFAVVGLSLLLSAGAACFAHCSLEAVERFL